MGGDEAGVGVVFEVLAVNESFQVEEVLAWPIHKLQYRHFQDVHLGMKFEGVWRGLGGFCRVLGV